VESSESAAPPRTLTGTSARGAGRIQASDALLESGDDATAGLGDGESARVQGGATPAEARKSAIPPARAGGMRQIDIPDALQPLGQDERPRPLLVAVAVAAALAIGICISLATVHDLKSHGGSLPGGLFLAAVLILLARGMYQRRYWAVLAFEALLAFQIIVTSLALIVAETLLAAGLCLLSICLAGWLFWKLVRVMGRIQAGEPGTSADVR